MKDESDISPKPTLDALVAERDRYVTRIFWFALEIALIFLLPALIAIFAFKAFFPVQPLWYPLPIAFIISWVLVIRKYSKLHKKLSTLDKQIVEAKKQTKDTNA